MLEVPNIVLREAAREIAVRTKARVDQANADLAAGLAASSPCLVLDNVQTIYGNKLKK